jgi:hypothetical protein
MELYYIAELSNNLILFGTLSSIIRVARTHKSQIQTKCISNSPDGIDLFNRQIKLKKEQWQQFKIKTK